MNIWNFINKYDTNNEATKAICKLFDKFSPEELVKLHKDIILNFIHCWAFENDIEFDESSNVKIDMEKDLEDKLRELFL